MYTPSTTEYESFEDICANCGKKGGHHFSSNGKSWCYAYIDQDQRDLARFRFAYKKPDKSNPNEMFKEISHV